MFAVEMLPAGHGDAIWIEYGSKRSPSRVLIDGGLSATYDAVKARAGKKCSLELMCITHIDQDHIEGAVKLLANLPPGMTLDEVWHNGYKHLGEEKRLGAAQAEKLQAAIVNHARAPWNAVFGGNAVVVPANGALPEKILPGGLRLTILSPGKAQLTRLRPVWEKECAKAGILPGVTESAEAALQADKRLRPRRLGAKLDVDQLAAIEFKSDTAKANGASIAFLAEFDGKAVLFAADAHSPVVEAGVKRLLAARGQSKLKLDAFKVSHHGSQFNNGHSLIDLLDCPSYLVSTNGDKFNHPDAETIARILSARRKSGTSLWFNYRSEQNGVWDVATLKKRWKYETNYPDTESGGIRIEL
jgi:beta-lactamase superfamily II metal-dependent hydrolase